MVSVGINTEEEDIYHYADTIGVNRNGEIKPRKHESLIELRLDHSVAKSWEDVEDFIRKKVKLPLVGKPWIANNGNLFMTIGFRTIQQEFENWKGKVFNWQSSGVRSVSSSRMLK